MMEIQFSNPKQSEIVDYDRGPIEFGRGPGHGTFRVQLRDGFVSRNQLRIEPLGSNRILMINLSERVPIKLAVGVIEPLDRREFDLPIEFSAGESNFEVRDKDRAARKPKPSTQDLPSEGFQTIMSPLGSTDAPTEAPRRLSELEDSDDLQTLARWFERLAEVQRAAADGDEFYEITARALVDLVGLDCGYVLRRHDHEWEVLACHTAEGAARTPFSPAVLRHIATERRTFYQDAENQIATQTMSDLSSVVASPVLQGDKVIGAIYGVRSCMMSDCHQAIRPLEAHVVQALAAAVVAGQARIRHEEEAQKKKILIKQFFSEILADELERDPTLLEGRSKTVTVLFSDIRNFSGLSEKTDARQTCDFVKSVMSRLTDHVRDHQGVVTSYLGDGLLAMWNAPVEQPNHAELACRAALAMTGELPAINAEWSTIVGAEVRIGIGINTGECMVGNTGSTHKFHYGPLGHTVNLGSRIESTTKMLSLPILISGSTKENLGDVLPTRKLCHARLAGISNPTELHELYIGNDPNWNEQRRTYQEALELFENRHFAQACEKLFPLLAIAQEQHDRPTLMLANLCIVGLQSTTDEFDPVWELAHK